MDRAAPGRQLLALLATVEPTDPAALARLGTEGWAVLAASVRLHRLGPLLHYRTRNAAFVPPGIAAEWRDAHRFAAITAMAQRADLEDCVGLLEGKGFAPVALKGAFLARHAYPEAALRPMRDLDLLLPGDQVLDAYACLTEAGFQPLEVSKIALADHARLEQHMPPLAMPRGTVLELHSRISERDGRLEYATPAGNEAALLARSIRLDGIRYPAPTDMLAHLVIHAVYGHRFDCGPLLLDDLHWLTASQLIDWPQFWQAAEGGGWQGGARLVAELVRIAHGQQAFPVTPGEPAAPAADVVELARELLVQNYETKKFARFLATVVTGGFGYVLRRLTGRVEASGEAGVAIDRGREGGKLRWALAQATGMARDLADPEVRRQVRRLAKFRRWITR